MFYKIKGILEEIDPEFIVINNNDISYKLFIKTNSKAFSKNIGDSEEFYTHLIINENETKFFGFDNKLDLDLFMLLTSVSGVGPKSALSILGLDSSSKLLGSIAYQDHSFIKGASGIGEKTAKRVVIDLKDKVKKLEGYEITEAVSQSNQTSVEAIEALTSLGYKEFEIRKALEHVDPNLSLEETIKEALSKL